ncbi:glutamate receptor ionotropic, kainate 1-like [Symsagittifera roscoffensis]|uniref:glutamate receptor ionotropic, kainate 1-like n=1 Tax=Symsagittifera roscoffensis TaxID=84072 RepID=UPI00307BC72F
MAAFVLASMFLFGPSVISSSSLSDDEALFLNVTTVLREPFLFDLVDLENNTRRVGYIKDLLEAMRLRIPFDYDFYLSPGGNYGAPDENGTWNGMVGEVLYGRADMAAADLTINAPRTEILTFSQPFMNVDLGVVYKKPSVQLHMLAFMMPFSTQVWCVILGSLVATSMSLYVFGIYNSKDDPLASVAACLYFGLACLFAQGPETYPRSMASRVTAISWWFFSLMMLTLYTASLTSMLTVNRATLPIDSIEDLLNYEAFHYGIEPGGSTQYAFQNSKYAPFQMMWAEMTKRKDTAFFRGAGGVERVRDREDYAFIRESPYLEYDITFAPCDLELVFSSSSPKSGAGYGFAFPKDHPLARNFSVEVLRMFSDGTLAGIHTKWFKTRSQCSEEKKLASFVDTIDFEEIQGVFFTFLGGIVLSFLFFVVRIARTAKDKTCPSSKKDELDRAMATANPLAANGTLNEITANGNGVATTVFSDSLNK